jgi:UDP-N-acetylmuramoylalanine--D-glutamate ligase
MKRIVILGAGESGTGAALLANAKGYDVFVSDMAAIADKYKAILNDNKIAFEEGQHTEDLILNADEIVKSPGIPDKAPIIKKLKEKNTPIIGEIELASRYTNAKIIAITGSNGKTTTTLLTYHLLKNAGFNVGLGGNIGDSMAKQVINDSFDYFVLELSSFQLDNLYQFKANVGMLLNITPDHLDRYDYKFENYCASKFRIIQNQTNEDYFITFIDSEPIADMLPKYKVDAQLLEMSLERKVEQGAYLSGDKIHFLVGTQTFDINVSKLPLQGKHNIANVIAAVLGLEALKQKVGITSTLNYQALLADFKNAEHRLEFVAKVKGVDYINDSKATNVDSVFYALDAMTKPVIWIAGGVDKGNDYNQIKQLVADKVKVLICMGKDNAALENFFLDVTDHIISTDSLSDAMQAAFESAENGDVVLLSPACASFDLFKNYEDRGTQFKLSVQGLQSKDENNLKTDNR